jgi:hypothetical protein
VCGSQSPNPHPPSTGASTTRRDVHWWPMRWPKGGIDQNRLGTPIHLSLAGAEAASPDVRLRPPSHHSLAATFAFERGQRGALRAERRTTRGALLRLGCNSE